MAIVMVQTAFITGMDGTAASNIVAVLRESGVACTVLIEQPVAGLEGYTTVAGDISNTGVQAAIAQSGAIVHLVCTGSPDGAEVIRRDIAFTSALIRAWRQGPFVFASSALVYGEAEGVLTEERSLYFTSGYDRAKFANELQLRLAERQGGRAGAVLLRFGPIFAADHRGYDRQLLDDVFTHCKRGNRCVFDSERGLDSYGWPFTGGGDRSRYVASALTHDLSGPFNAASGFCTWRELIQTINRLAGTKADFVVRPDTRPQAGEFRLPQSRTELDTTAFQQATGFQPRETLEEVVEAYIRAERSARAARTS